MADLPAITGNELIKLLAKDGWQEGRRANHGRSMTKEASDRVLVTIIPMSNEQPSSRKMAPIRMAQPMNVKKFRLIFAAMP